MTVSQVLDEINFLNNQAEIIGDALNKAESSETISAKEIEEYLYKHMGIDFVKLGQIRGTLLMQASKLKHKLNNCEINFNE